ncbi:MAG: oxidoreductase [Nisaea sp.]|jgi:hypothetical protein|nr:oxidoreductase [Nisaea sp.]OUX92298.1 MAG: hypothetical protein CBB86_12190 [Candidatus Endolissoclinum sp. TMED26]|tara:strand:- start:79 stop:384 length:306 start_codon:yes stop_codon:yes gene_type:complete
MRARIYRPTKTAMQSGRTKARTWTLDYEPASARRPEPLMGWVAAADTSQQVRLSFDSEAEAVAYAERHKIDYVVLRPRERKIRPKVYADNFSTNRKFSWTH